MVNHLMPMVANFEMASLNFSSHLQTMSHISPSHLSDLRVGGKYRFGTKIGSGSFGEIYLGTNVVTHEDVAIKIEPLRSKHPQLEYEARVYKTLAGGGNYNDL